MANRRPSIQTAALSAALLTLSFQAGSASSTEERPAPPNVPEVVRARTFEVLDAEGRVAARIGSNDFGGTVDLYSHVDEDGEPRRFAFIGCTFPGCTDFILSPPEDDDEARLWMTVYGEPNRAEIVGTASNGKQQFALRTAADEQSVFTLWNSVNGEVRFER